jgi:hypothetical protein
VNTKRIEEILIRLKTELDDIEPLEGERGQALESLKQEGESLPRAVRTGLALLSGSG